MKKNLFWVGVIGQIIHLIVFVALASSTMDWGFINKELVLWTGYIIFNVATLIMIFVGAISD